MLSRDVLLVSCNSDVALHSFPTIARSTGTAKALLAEPQANMFTLGWFLNQRTQNIPLNCSEEVAKG